MPFLRFVVTIAFAWLLIRATFANTASWRHPQALLGTLSHYAGVTKKSIASQRIASRNGT